MKLFQFLLPVLLLIYSYGQSEEVYIPWKSSILKQRNVFLMQVGDVLVFLPCGDSSGTNVVYTNSNYVFDHCIRDSSIRDSNYLHVGTCLKPLVQVWWPVKDNQYLYFLSDFMTECEKGLKAIAIVNKKGPSTGKPITFPVGSSDGETNQTSSRIHPTPAGHSRQDEASTRSAGMTPTSALDNTTTLPVGSSDGKTSQTSSRIHPTLAGHSREDEASTRSVEMTPTSARDNTDDEVSYTTSEDVGDSEIGYTSARIHATPTGDCCVEASFTVARTNPTPAEDSNESGIITADGVIIAALYIVIIVVLSFYCFELINRTSNGVEMQARYSTDNEQHDFQTTTLKDHTSRDEELPKYSELFG